MDPFFDFVFAGCSAGEGFVGIEGGELEGQSGGVGACELFGFVAAEHFEHVGVDETDALDLAQAGLWRGCGRVVAGRCRIALGEVDFLFGGCMWH